MFSESTKEFISTFTALVKLSFLNGSLEKVQSTKSGEYGGRKAFLVQNYGMSPLLTRCNRILSSPNTDVSIL